MSPPSGPGGPRPAQVVLGRIPDHPKPLTCPSCPGGVLEISDHPKPPSPVPSCPGGSPNPSPVPVLPRWCSGGSQTISQPLTCPRPAQVVFRNALEIPDLSQTPHLSLSCPGGVPECTGDLRPVPNPSPVPVLPRWCSGGSQTCPKPLTCPRPAQVVFGRSQTIPDHLLTLTCPRPAQVVFRNALEIGFLGGQYFLYGFNVPAIFECDRYPCVKEVECYVSRPTEKSVFLVFMFAVSGVCVLLNLAELNQLGWRKARAAVRGARARRRSPGEARRREPAAPALGRTQSSESAYV
ncbi:hypothetical protein DV515_00019799 [Chloebia gouldiae]|uniref:Gap junction protein n=1 Tax=Chloebia gouldiae TaxID=44316 RepID=A0A3L8Q3P5_CHLGU|nr:hypothetical protein DV515_00019799 [Chloebia gouldiae]